MRASNIYYPGTHTYKNKHFSPDYIQNNPVELEIRSIDNKFKTLTNQNLKQKSVRLTQELCSEPYFIYGGFNASQLIFDCYDPDLNSPPEGKIQFSITPTVYKNGEFSQLLANEKKNLFTGIIDRAEPIETIPGMWRITAYDALHRARNMKVGHIIERLKNAGGGFTTWAKVKDAIEDYLMLKKTEPTPAWMNDILYPTNRETNPCGIDILRQFALVMRRFGYIDGDGNLQYLHIDNWNDSYTKDNYICVNLFDPKDLSYGTGHIWRPVDFDAEPQTNKFVKFITETPEILESFNVYTISNSDILGDQEWIDEQYGCDEYGEPNPAYNANNLPTGIFDTMRLTHGPNDIYECQEYEIRAAQDPTIPMGTQLFVYKINSDPSGTGWQQIVRSYIMKRTIHFISGELIECELSAENSSYNGEKYEYDSRLETALNLANYTRKMSPVIADGGTVNDLRAVKTMKKSEFDTLPYKREDTLYFIEEVTQ